MKRKCIWTSLGAILVVSALVYYGGGWIPLHHALQPWHPRGEFALQDSGGREYSVSVSAKYPMEVPGDHPDIRLTVESDKAKQTIAQRLPWFRFHIGEIRVKTNTLHVFHGYPATNHLGAIVRITGGKPEVIQVYPRDQNNVQNIGTNAPNSQH
jgi:hypothetical protein